MAKCMLRDEIAGDGCVLCLPMNECAGSYVYDRSGYGNHGTIYGATWQGSRPRNALKFDGEQTYVEIPYSQTINPEHFTISAWAKVEGNSGQWRSVITSRSTADGSKGYIIYASANNKWEFWVGTGSWQSVVGPAITLGKWYHLVAVYDGTMKFYVDNELVGTGNYNYVPNPDRPCRIGAGATEASPRYFFNGLIGPVRIYNRALSADEVRDHFLGRYTDNSGLRLYLPMNEGAGSTVWDRSPYGNHGTLYNFPDTSAGYGDTHDSGWTRYGRYENGYLYFGGNDYVDLNPFGPSATPESFTVSFWLKSELPVDVPNHAFILAPTGGTSPNYWFVALHNGKQIAFTLRKGTGSYSNANLLKPHEWNHIVCVFEVNTRQQIYVNGELKANSTPAFSGGMDSDKYFYIGYRGWWGSDDVFYKGIIDEVRIYNRALSAEEIQALYRGARVLAQRNLAVIR